MLRNQPEIDGSYLQNHGSHIRVEAESHVTQDCLPHLQNKTTTKTKPCILFVPRSYLAVFNCMCLRILNSVISMKVSTFLSGPTWSYEIPCVLLP